jgi:ABC-2 type transport system ATP-binding protein
MDEAEYCDRITMMVEGKIKAIGSLKELLTTYNAKNMDEVFIKLAR